MLLAMERNSLKSAHFRLAVTPQEDELLSSWLIRTAHAHRVDTATFINQHFPEWKNSLWRRDIDGSADDDLLNSLAFKSGLDYDALYNLTLKTYDGYLVEKITKARNIFIQPLGNYSHIKVKDGLRFCPKCLQEDKKPYFRKKWRLSFSTACIKHRCFLLDRCPNCGASLTLNRGFYDFNFPDCYKCGFSFAVAEPEYIPPASYGIKAIEKLYLILENGYYKIEDRYAYSFSLFKVIRLFAKIVYFWDRNKGFLDHEVMSQTIAFGAHKPTSHLLEDIPLKEQYLLFSGLMRLFENFSGTLLSFCAANQLIRTDLTTDMKNIPFWYQKVVEAFEVQWPQVSLEEVKSVIKYLRKKRMSINKAKVARIMGVCPDFKKRKDIMSLFAN